MGAHGESYDAISKAELAARDHHRAVGKGTGAEVKLDGYGCVADAAQTEPYCAPPSAAVSPPTSRTSPAPFTAKR